VRQEWESWKECQWRRTCDNIGPQLWLLDSVWIVWRIETSVGVLGGFLRFTKVTWCLGLFFCLFFFPLIFLYFCICAVNVGVRVGECGYKEKCSSRDGGGSGGL